MALNRPNTDEIRGDAQREHGDDDERVAGAAAQHADRIADVLGEIDEPFPPRAAPAIAWSPRASA